MSYTPLQARYASDSWRVLVVCALLNLTTRVQVRAVLDELFDRWPDPYALLTADEQEVKHLLRRLGMVNQRYGRLHSMAISYLESGEPRSRADILALHGCGDYAADAWEVFCRGNLDVEPGDGVLRSYVASRRAEDVQHDGDLVFRERAGCLDPEVCRWPGGRCVEPSRCTAPRDARKITAPGRWSADG